MSRSKEELLELVKKLPSGRVEEVTKIVTEILQEESERKTSNPQCYYCKGTHVVKNGHKHNKQSFLCRSCGKSFVETTNTAMEYSHYNEPVWKKAARDTLNGVSLRKTAETLGFSHQTAFCLRHKILSAREKHEELYPTILNGVCELDDTYVLENLKGTKIPDDSPRKARKHGAKAQKRGISNEYVSLCAGLERKGKIYTKTVNRATPPSKNIKEVFYKHIEWKTLVLCDGAKGFNILSNKCEVCHVNKNEDSKGFHHINTVNGYHSFIKDRYRKYRGVATKYLNRYNVLFSKAYKTTPEEVDSICDILSKTFPKGKIHKRIKSIKTEGILLI
jgi:transposase-like protein